MPEIHHEAIISQLMAVTRPEYSGCSYALKCLCAEALAELERLRHLAFFYQAMAELHLRRFDEDHGNHRS